MPPYRDYRPTPGSLRSLAHGGDRITDLIMARGQAEAEGEYRGAQIRSDAIGGGLQQLGGMLSQFGQQRATKEIAVREQSKRSAAIDKLFSGDTLPDPKEVIRVLGHKDGLEVLKGLKAIQPNTPAADYKDRMERVRDAALGVRAMPADKRPAAWQVANNGLLAAKVITPEEAQTYAEFSDDTLAQLANYGQPAKQPGTREIKTRNPDGSETTRIVADTPGQEFGSAAPPTPKHKVTTTGPDGRPLEKLVDEATLTAGVPGYRAPVAQPKPSLERVETVDAQGKPVTQFVTPAAGATYAKPTGAGKPATGQQRKALNFFNRGKEAQEIASAMEEGGEVSALKVKYIPEWANILRSNPEQAYVQSQRAFTEARLRKDSGAAVPKHEYETDALTYFKQPGDSPATIAQKRASRNAILAGIAFESGDALREFYGDDSEAMLADYKRHSKAGGAPAAPPSKRANPFR